MAEALGLTKQELQEMLTEEAYDTIFVAFMKGDVVSAQIAGSPNNVAKIFAGILIHDPEWSTAITHGVYSAVVHLIGILEDKDDKEAIMAGDKLTKIGPVFEELADAIRRLGLDSAARAISQMITESKEGEQNGS